MWIRLKAFLIWFVARILLGTLRLRMLHVDRLTRARQDGRPVIYAFWHGRQIAYFYHRPEKRLTVMTSLSADGELQTQICRRFGLDVARGSSSRGGLRALVGLSRALREGQSVGMAVDGPRGPAEEPKAGVLALAQQSGVSIIPISVGYSRKRVLRRAWDGFQIPKVFSRAVMGYGKALAVPRDANPDDLEALRLALRDALLALGTEVDAAASRS
ncbi:MAG: hypothetical protein DRH24_19665 [Deltaproteobacteria bacterium]|nr:MAG: hypothetical protein DRH24_19665 [Deltaproteobacteria bacterium]